MKLKDLFITESQQLATLKQALSQHLAVNTEKGCFVVTDVPSSTSPEQWMSLISNLPVSNQLKKQIANERVKDIDTAINYWTQAAQSKYKQDANNHLGEYFKSGSWQQFVADRKQYDAE